MFGSCLLPYAPSVCTLGKQSSLGQPGQRASTNDRSCRVSKSLRLVTKHRGSGRQERLERQATGLVRAQYWRFVAQHIVHGGRLFCVRIGIGFNFLAGRALSRRF